jgi:hypothetical protein
MKNFRAADKSHAGGDEKHDINFHWPTLIHITNLILHHNSGIIVHQQKQVIVKSFWSI